MFSPYPKYVYHPDHNEPRRVDSKPEEQELGTKGWTASYIHKEYPKWIGDKLVQSKEEAERLNLIKAEVKEAEVVFEANVVKETQVDGQDTAVFEKPKGPGRPPKKK